MLISDWFFLLFLCILCEGCFLLARSCFIVFTVFTFASGVKCSGSIFIMICSLILLSCSCRPYECKWKAGKRNRIDSHIVSMWQLYIISHFFFCSHSALNSQIEKNNTVHRTLKGSCLKTLHGHKNKAMSIRIAIRIWKFITKRWLLATFICQGKQVVNYCPSYI